MSPARGCQGNRPRPNWDKLDEARDPIVRMRKTPEGWSASIWPYRKGSRGGSPLPINTVKKDPAAALRSLASLLERRFAKERTSK